MNQILVTGDEVITDGLKKQKQQKMPKEKKVLPVNGIILFYAICIIILGICMISGSVYAKTKINETVEANIKPEITVERNEDDNSLQITVTHKRGIRVVNYNWNDEPETTIYGNNKEKIKETIKLIGGENTLKITAIEKDGQKQTFEKTFIVGNIPEIEDIESVDNGVKIIARSEEKIDYIQYSWDNGEMQKIEVGKEEYEGIINAPKGKHTLKIEVVDSNGMIAEVERQVIGDTVPTLDVQSKLVNGKATFVIDAEDDENIKKVEIIHNGGEKQEIEVNEKTYHEEILMTEGEENRIIVTVINENDLQQTRRIKFNNK